MKPANTKTRALRAKLEALAERGIAGEKTAATARLKRLLSRYDFDAPDPTATPDLFAGKFVPAAASAWVYAFEPTDSEIASFVKWAIEHSTGIECAFHGLALHVHAASSTAEKLAGIALHIAESFRQLRRQFCTVAPQDARLFTRGLYDGMMNDGRQDGETLPARAPVPIVKSKRKQLTAPPVLNVHPYSLALPLGKQIRFSVPIEKVSADLEAAMTHAIPSNCP